MRGENRALKLLCKQERQQCIIRRDEKRRFSPVDMLVSGYFVAWLQSLVKPLFVRTLISLKMTAYNIPLYEGMYINSILVGSQS